MPDRVAVVDLLRVEAGLGRAEGRCAAPSSGAAAGAERRGAERAGGGEEGGEAEGFKAGKSSEIAEL